MPAWCRGERLPPHARMHLHDRNCVGLDIREGNAVNPIDMIAEYMKAGNGDDRRDDLAKAIHFNITNVWNYASQFGEESPHEIEFAVPPWPLVFAQSNLRNGCRVCYLVRTMEKPADDAHAWEMLCYIWTISDSRTVSLAWRGTYRLTRTGLVSERAQWEHVWNRRWADAAHLSDVVRQDLRELDADIERLRAEFKAKFPTEFAKRENDPKFSKVIERREIAASVVDDVDIPDSIMMVFLLATMLANCKNVAQKAENVPVKILKAREKRNRVPVDRWYTLAIEPMQKKIAAGLGDDGALLRVDRPTYEKAFHICRGHFKEFTAAKPLFGRISGRFWWPMHTRGNRQLGSVTKDYAIAERA